MQEPRYDEDDNWEQVCQAAQAKPLVPPHSVGPLVGDRLTKCDEAALYYGLGNQPNYAAALQCGWYERAHPRSDEADLFYGPGVLAMLYANGQGVARNYDLAIRFSCENDWTAKAEMALRIGHLEFLRKTNPPTTKFDLCDDITSGLGEGECTRIVTRAADAVRNRKIAAIVATLPPAAKTSFASLQAAEAAFEDSRIGTEVDLSGSGRAAFELEDQRKLGDQFLINLQRFGKGDIPKASADDLAELDGKLNEVYQQIQHSPASEWEVVTIKPSGIRETERKWVALADAWMAFSRLAYPDLAPTRVRAQLIRLRLHQLRSLYGGNRATAP